MKIDFGSVKQRTAINDGPDACAVLYRSKIDHDGAEISLLYHFGAVARGCAYLCFLAKVVPRGEIFINPSDPKHVA